MQGTQTPSKVQTLVEFMHLVFTRMPGDSYRRRLRSLERWLTPLCVDFARAPWASSCFRFVANVQNTPAPSQQQGAVCHLGVLFLRPTTRSPTAVQILQGIGDAEETRRERNQTTVCSTGFGFYLRSQRVKYIICSQPPYQQNFGSPDTY